MIPAPGEVSERFKEHAWKACVWGNLHRGFESLSLRQQAGIIYIETLLADEASLKRARYETVPTLFEPSNHLKFP